MVIFNEVLAGLSKLSWVWMVITSEASPPVIVCAAVVKTSLATALAITSNESLIPDIELPVVVIWTSV